MKLTPKSLYAAADSAENWYEHAEVGEQCQSSAETRSGFM